MDKSGRKRRTLKVGVDVMHIDQYHTYLWVKIQTKKRVWSKTFVSLVRLAMALASGDFGTVTQILNAMNPAYLDWYRAEVLKDEFVGRIDMVLDDVNALGDQMRSGELYPMQITHESGNARQIPGAMSIETPTFDDFDDLDIATTPAQNNTNAAENFLKRVMALQQ